MSALLRFSIDPDIRRASTLPARVYRDPEVFEAQRERIFARAWHPLPDEVRADAPGAIHPFVLMPALLDEPLLLTRSEDREFCLSNVCTHRGNLVASEPGCVANLRCGYHGRRFALDGTLLHMPEFENVADFPSPRDHLPRLPLRRFGPLHFTSVLPGFDFDEALEPIRARVSFIPLDRLTLDPASVRRYEVRANWALYCDNYLEGFHIPFVHAGLAEHVEYPSYRVETFGLASLQTAFAKGHDEPAFEPPEGHPDHGRRVAGYYAWLFPHVMFNFYPWGLSLNVVIPQAVDRTVVLFASYVGDDTLRARGAGSDLDRVEREDEEIVEAVQRGVRSRLYDRGRYAPEREQAVHHFHRRMAEWLSDDSRT